MKKIILLIVLFSSIDIAAQTAEANLDGLIFRGKATEQTPPDVDRMPLIYDEVIIFENGIVKSEVLKIYSSNECKYTSEEDLGRMIAVKVIKFNSSSIGKINGSDVSIEFNGNIYADIKLSGDLIIRYPDNSEVKFLIEASLE